MLAADGGAPALATPVGYPWPKRDPRWIDRVVAQVTAGNLSIYDRSGVVEEIEDAWSALHGVEHSLAVSSGTSALHSAFYALGIGPGDEVLVPAYTFFATAVPLFQLGAVPVLVDCDVRGSFDCGHAESLVGPRTSAVVVTHMWGLPCAMDQVVAFTSRHGLGLVEDCSHAHGATFNGQLVGTFGDAGAWSMQTQKLIAGGEAGMMATRSRDVYDRAQLLGHFNKRAQAEMDPSGDLHRYADTGTGLKYRAHPLALAFAVGQVAHLPDWIQAKQTSAERLRTAFEQVPGVSVVTRSTGERISAHYALLLAVDADVIHGGRDRLADVIQREGIEDLDVPRATSPLQTYEIFRSPISPVHTYTGSSVRSELPRSTALSQDTMKISVPCFPAGYHAEDEHYLRSVELVLEKVAESTEALTR